MSDVVVYSSGEIELKVSVENDTIWLTQKQLAKVFNVNIPAISKHIKNIYKDEELSEFSTVSKMEIVQKEGTREIVRIVEHYNLDIVLSVGYRVNSTKAIKFRQWATLVLKDYISSGYVVNREKITQQRLLNLEDDVKVIKTHIANGTLKLEQKVFFNGEVFDAYTFILDIIRSAKESITLIDNYVDDTTLTMLSKNQNINTHIYTHTISKQLKLDLNKYSKQYKPITVIKEQRFHDRYLIVDRNRVYNIGASLKDVGNKTFTVSLLNDFNEKDILRKINV